MRARQTLTVFALAALLSLSVDTGAQPIVPGVTGFGVNTIAARGGKIIRVKNLNDAGSGSLRACLNASGPRYCVFEVSGVIRLESDLTIKEGNVTIAGQTAPSPGIMIRGATLVIRASDILIQHVAIRPGDAKDGPLPQGRDSIKIAGSSPLRNIVLDHVSLSWAVDENLSAFDDVRSLTVSHSILSEPLHDSIHPKGPHGLVALIDPSSEYSRVAFVGNLFAHGHGRNPWSSAASFAFVNNVVYNTRDSDMLLTNRHGISTRSSVVGNVFIKGVNSSDAVKPVRLLGEDSWGSAILQGTRLYLADNDSEYTTDDPWSVVHNKSDLARTLIEILDIPVWPDGLHALKTDDGEVLGYVLANAGTRPAQRNSVDARIVQSVRDRSGQIINCVADNGSTRCQKNAGGWPKLSENVRQLDIPEEPHADWDEDGYTNIEEWLHALAAEVEGRSPSAVPDPGEPAHSPPKPPMIRDTAD